MARQCQIDARYKRAKEEGFAARSVYKLQEMDRRYGLLRPGQRVVDLGCHPGSWLQYVGKVVGPQGLVVGVDLKPPTVTLPNWARFIEADLLTLTPQDLAAFAPDYDLLISDAAPATTGVREADAARSLELGEHALELALALLKPGGSFLAKLYQGPETEQLIRRLKRHFTLGKGHKPQASRSESRELFVLGRGLKKP